MLSRITFSSVGFHPQLELCESSLIADGYQYIPWTQVESSGIYPHFIVAGAGGELPKYFQRVPTIILSSGHVYSCVKSDGAVDDVPFLEHQPLVVPSTIGTPFQAQSIYEESLARATFPDHAVLRLFDIYGPGTYGWVNFYVEQLNTHAPLLVQHSPHRKLSCLFVDDFREALLAFVKKFLSNQVRGLYNLGADQATTFAHLADTVYQAWSGTREKAPIHLEPAADHVNFYEVPDITRIKALLRWSPKVTLRKGVWMAVQELK